MGLIGENGIGPEKWKLDLVRRSRRWVLALSRQSSATARASSQQGLPRACRVRPQLIPDRAVFTAKMSAGREGSLRARLVVGPGRRVDALAGPEPPPARGRQGPGSAYLRTPCRAMCPSCLSCRRATHSLTRRGFLPQPRRCPRIRPLRSPSSPLRFLRQTSSERKSPGRHWGLRPPWLRDATRVEVVGETVGECRCGVFVECGCDSQIHREVVRILDEI